MSHLPCIEVKIYFEFMVLTHKTCIDLEPLAENKNYQKENFGNFLNFLHPTRNKFVDLIELNLK